MLVGGFEEQDRVSETVRRSLECDARVHITGFVDRPAPYYAIMDVLMLPSHREGFGLVVAEASAMCVPVVSTRIPGCIDAVAEGHTGMLVSVVAERIAAIERYLLDPR